MNSSRKLQVFVSSTYKDLKDARQAAVEAILQAGHIPAGMELFAAGDESQWETIKQWIDESDALLLILGERYGSIEPKSKKSYTQLEYEYAVERKKKVFAMVLGQEWIDRKYVELKGEATDGNRTKHDAFKEMVKNRMSAFVNDAKDLRYEVGKSLSVISRDATLAGWVRGDALARSEATVSELLRTVEALRSKPASGGLLKADIDGEIAGRVAELREAKIEHQVGTKRVEGSALDILWAVRGKLRVTPQQLSFGGLYEITADSNDPLERTYFDAVHPILEIWGLVVPESQFAMTSAKGKLLMMHIGTTGATGIEEPTIIDIRFAVPPHNAPSA